MASKLPQFVIRAESEILEKIKFIADKNKRSTTQEIVYIIEKHINEYEIKNGEIPLHTYPLEIPYAKKDNKRGK